jgi:anti-sigma-K factor RskA
MKDDFADDRGAGPDEPRRAGDRGAGPVNHDELRDSIPALALNALPRTEQLLVEAHVSRCSGCSFEYRQYQEVAALLAHLAPPIAPPASLWESIEEEIDREVRPAPAVSPFTPLATSPNGTRLQAGTDTTWRARFSKHRIAALATAAVLVLGGVTVSLFHRPGGERPLSGRDLAQSIRSHAHTTVAMHATGLAPGAGGEILVGPDGKVAVSMHGLPSPGSGTYTMWLLADGQARALGDFRPDASGKVTMATDRTAGYAPNLVVTLESRSGNSSPTGPRILNA